MWIPRGTDEAFAFKDVNCVCHSRSANSEHCCEIVVRDPDVLAADPILTHQQPAGEPLFDMATRIRWNRASHLLDKSLVEASARILQFRKRTQHRKEIIRVDPPRLPGIWTMVFVRECRTPFSIEVPTNPSLPTIPTSILYWSAAMKSFLQEPDVLDPKSGGLDRASGRRSKAIRQCRILIASRPAPWRGRSAFQASRRSFQTFATAISSSCGRFSPSAALR